MRTCVNVRVARERARTCARARVRRYARDNQWRGTTHDGARKNTRTRARASRRHRAALVRVVVVVVVVVVMGVCVSVHTVEHELAAEAAIERKHRLERLEESLAAHDNRLVLHGVLARGDAVNRNGRVYPRAILARELAAYVSTHVARKSAFGEFEHPSAEDATRFKTVRDECVSHRVLEAYWRGDCVYGVVEILDATEAGREVWDIYRDGGLVGASTRSWSSLETRSDGKTYVDDDMELLCFDLVRDPSTYSLTSKSLLTPLLPRYEGWDSR